MIKMAVVHDEENQTYHLDYVLAGGEEGRLTLHPRPKDVDLMDLLVEAGWAETKP